MKTYKKIEPLNTMSLVDKVELRLMEFFKENNLKPGDAIPKELDLAESMGVSRTVIREAILRLRTLGFIESKKHRGMIFKEPDIINNFERVLDPTLLSRNTLKSLFELRLMLEMGMADFLFEYKTDKDIAELEAIVLEEERISSGKTWFTLDREIAFHGKLYQISKNSTLMRFQNLLLPVFEYVYLQEAKQQTPDQYHKTIHGKVVTHGMLVEELKSGTPDSFQMAMRTHLDPHFNSLFKRL